MSTTQWWLGGGTYSVHRLVWAWHNPDNANPAYIKFVDGDRTNTRIENLEAKNVHPRWEGHVKHNATIDAYGNITILNFPKTNAKPKRTFLETIYTPKPKPVAPVIDTSFVDELEASMDDDFVGPNKLDTSSPSGDECNEWLPKGADECNDRDYFNYQ
jgi:hypothetical protein